jgi:hypothetical protein
MYLDRNADYTTKDGADRLVSEIRAFWQARGKQVRVRAHRVTGIPGERWDVRSDMVGGRP